MKIMKINIQAIEKNYLRMQIKQDPHTLFNLLRILALEEDGVTLCGYARDRTFEDSLMFQIRTEGDVDPREALIRAARKIAANAEQFKAAFEDTYL
ncbi:MAG: RpoL/Rpb11 RNA polymerase subunit family protein [Candidatus Kariarchaeaceae archaeon]|jgi:DNA-directed RNA polymerase subunit L